MMLLAAKKNSLRYAVILISEVVRSDFKLRYNDSAVGYLWSLLKPLAFFTILYIVFAKVFRISDIVPHYPVYLLVGIIAWSFFSEITNTGVTAVVEKGDLLRKISFPKYSIIVAKAISATINLFINLFVIALFMVLFGSSPSLQAIIFVPLLILELLILGVGLSFLLSTLYVRLRDISYIWELVMQALFYATPLLYPLSFVTDNFSVTAAKVMMLNPLAQIAQDARLVLVTPQTMTFEQLFGSGVWRLVPIMVVFGIFMVGFWYFRKKQMSFSEEV